MQKNTARYAKKIATAAAQEPDAIRVEVSEDIYAGKWDGNEPLDPEKTWTPYDIRIVRTCGHCEEESTVDWLGGTYATNDSEGKQYVRDTIANMLLEYDDMPGIDDVEIIYG